jgi:hypothetical protein
LQPCLNESTHCSLRSALSLLRSMGSRRCLFGWVCCLGRRVIVMFTSTTSKSNYACIRCDVSSRHMYGHEDTN